jgi:hypothetical protein
MNLETDLFGLAPVQPPPKKGRSAQKSGYAALPGTGPEGETCKTCAHYVSTCPGGRKRFPKCGLMRSRWTHGQGTDIKAGSPACREWRKKP